MDETRDEIKRFLASYIYAIRRADQIEIEIEYARQSQIMPSKGLDGMPRSFKISDLSDYAVRIDDLLKELCGQYNKVTLRKRLVIQLIDQLESETEKLILWYRYVTTDARGNRLSWDKIGDKARYSPDYARKLRDKAVESLLPIWPEFSRQLSDD